MGFFGGGGSGGTPGGSAGQLQYNNSSAFGGMSGTSWDDTNRSLTITGATVTTSKPVFDLSQTWNAAGTLFTGIKFNVVNTASANNSLLIDLQVGGSSKFNADKIGNIISGGWFSPGQGNNLGGGNATIRLAAGADGISVTRGDTSATGYAIYGRYLLAQSIGAIGFISTDLNGNTQDVTLFRDAANILALRNSTNAQTFRAYNTYTDASNYAFGFLDAGVTTANTLTLGTTGLGTGATTLSKAALRINGTLIYDYAVTTAITHTFAGNVTSSGAVTAGTSTFSSTGFRTNKGSLLSPSSATDGMLRLTNSAETDFSILQFGGNTTSFPSLKKINATIAVRLADDSGDTDLTLRACQHNGVTYANRPGTPVAGMVIYVTDSTVTTAGSTVAGGGANKVLAWYNGTNWTVIGN